MCDIPNFAADGTHFWFPQASLTFEGGGTIAVNVQLADDSQG